MERRAPECCRLYTSTPAMTAPTAVEMCSGMEQAMRLENFSVLNKNDTVKFVAGCHEDLVRTKQIIEKYNLYGKCNLYISPVFGMIEPEEIVDFMKDNTMNDVNMQIQLHKIIWAPDKRGV